MTALPQPERLTPREYLRRERLAEGKSEYQRGEVVAMGGASRYHGRLSMNLSGILYEQLRGGPCRAYAADQRVSIKGGEAYLYPDLAVICGPEEFEDDQFDSLVNPIVVIEILSPTTESRDRGAKFHDYTQIPSLREYVLVSQRPRRIEVYRRGEDGAWTYRSWPFNPWPVRLESIGCTLDPEVVYERVEDGPGDAPIESDA